MSLSAAELDQVARELARLVGARVQKVSVTAAHTLYVEVREPGASRLLLFEAGAGLGRAGVVANRAAAPAHPFAFQGLLRAHLMGARLDRVSTDGAAHSLRVHLATDAGEHGLVLEVEARGGLVALLDKDDVVLGVMPPDRARERGLVRGTRYAPPPARPPAATDRFVPTSEPYGYSAAIERHYGGVERAQSAREARSSVVPALRAARKRSTRTLDNVRQDLGRIDEAGAYQRFGDLLKPQLHTIRRGSTEARVTEYGEDGAHEVTVPLLPQLSPKENLERYYHLHRRLTRAADRVLERLVELEARHARLDALLARAEATTDEAVLLAIAEEARAGGLLREASARAAKPGEAPARVPYREFRSATGLRIWVGRNARDNDALTFRLARGNDFWLHARGLTGSHVVVPGTGPEGPDGETLLDAATLAAHFSSGREELRVDVAATRRKYVHKPKGAAPGAVTFTQDRNIPLRFEAPRLARLLEGEGKAPG